MADRKSEEFLGCRVDTLVMQEAVSALLDAVTKRRVTSVSFLNAGKIAAMEKDEKLRNSVANSDFCFADGQAVVWGGRYLGVDIPERVAGIDLMMELLREGSEKGFSFFFLGATLEVLGKTVEKVKELFPGIKVAGAKDGYYQSEAEVVEAISGSSADILFIGMSSPKKENFTDANIDRLGVSVVMGVGGSFDVLAGKAKRAPMFLQKLGLEWFYRFLQEPGRMWKRYLVGNSLFLQKLFTERILLPVFLFLFVKLLLFAFITPPWMGNDEPNHFDYVMVKAGRGDGNSNQAEIIKSLNATGFWEKAEMKKPKLGAKFFNETALKQHSESFSPSRPPLYYFLASLPLKLFKTVDIESSLLLSRMVSVVFTMLTFLFIYLAGDNIFKGPYREWLATASLLIAGLHPQFSYMGVMVNSDVLLILLFTITFYLITMLVKKRGVSLEEMLLLLFLSCAAVITKQYGVILLSWVAVGFAVAVYGNGKAKLFKKLGILFLFLFASLLLLEFFLPLAVIKVADRVGISAGYFLSSPGDWAGIPLSEWMRAVGTVFVTSWFTLGQMVHKMSFGLYLLLFAFTVAVCFGLLGGLKRDWKRNGDSEADFRSILFSIFCIFTVFIVLFLFFSTENYIHRASGRYLFYAIAPASMLVVYSLRSLNSFWKIEDAEGFGVLFFLLLNFISVFGYLLPIYYA